MILLQTPWDMDILQWAIIMYLSLGYIIQQSSLELSNIDCWTPASSVGIQFTSGSKVANASKGLFSCSQDVYVHMQEETSHKQKPTPTWGGII